MKLPLSFHLTTVVVLGFLALPARAGIVLDWNSQAISAVDTSNTSAPEAARNLAILQTAIYDAVNGIDGGHQKFYVTDLAPTGASIDAAAAAAANTIMSALYPTLGSSFATLYNDQLTAISDGQSKTDGINWGNQVATAILNWRSGDGANNAASTPYAPSGQLGGWAPTPHSNPSLNYVNPPTLPGWGNVTPFAMTSGSQYRPNSFGGLTAQQYLQTSTYATDYNFVKDYGSKVGSLRTADQTAAAYFWNDVPGSITAVGQWNKIAQHMLGNTSGTVNEAVIMAALNVALADASIASWDAKYSADFWRPITAIAYGDNDGNSATIGDGLAGIPGVGWEPLLDTPSTPEFVTENSTFSSAAVNVLKNYLGDVSLSYMGDTDGDGLPDTVRNWISLSAVADEAALSAIYGGYGTLYSAEQGKTLGTSVADRVLATSFAVVPEPSSLLMLSAAALTLLRRRRVVQA